MYLFVYGTLKRGCSNNYLMKGISYVGEDKTKDSHCMINLGRFPAIFERKGTTSIKGETFLVNGEHLKALDAFEGKWFYRKKVLLESGINAYTYFLSPDATIKNYPVIEDGNWTAEYGKQQE